VYRGDDGESKHELLPIVAVKDEQMVQQTVTSLQTGALCLPSIRLNKKENNLRSCTVHFDSIKSFICPTNAQQININVLNS